MTDARRDPPRLLEQPGAVGDCLREALAEQDLTQSLPRFTDLRERRLRQLRTQRTVSLLALAAAALLSVRLFQDDEQLPTIRAEVAATTPAELTAAAPAPSGAQAAPPPAPVVLPPPPDAPAHVKPKLSASGLRVEPQAVLADQAKSSPPEQPSSSAKACAQLARDGAAERALTCYRDLSSGAGMTAELALFEQARIEGKVLRRPERALATLEIYRQRFPQGSLRAEVMLAQIDWLLASGDSTRAHQLVDEALASGLLRERTAELERLRAKLR